MRRTLLVLAVFFLGCAKSEPPAETTPTPEAPAAIALADVAGTWDGTITAAGSDSVLVVTEMTATGEPTGWVLKVANAKTPTEWTTVAPTSVVASGDSVVMDAGPFKSVLRAGQDVSTHSVYRLVDGSLIGTMWATYPASGDMIELRSTATRRP